jgi:hypothetical protein
MSLLSVHRKHDFLGGHVGVKATLFRVHPVVWCGVLQDG